MYAIGPASMIDRNFQGTYASSTRIEDSIRNNLAALMEDFTLSDEIIGDNEDQFWLTLVS